MTVAPGASESNQGIRIHLDNAAASRPHPETVHAVIGYVRAEADLGPIEAGLLHAAEAEALYGEAATLLDATPAEIAWCDSGSRAWITAVSGVPWSAGDRIIVSELDYGGSLATLVAAAQRYGASVEVGPCDDHGQLDPAALAVLLRSGPRAVAVTHAAAHCGAVNDVASIGAMTRDAEVLFLLDAAQSVGQFPISVGEIACDVLCASGRKWLRGPRGSGLLYVREETTRELIPAGGDPASVTLAGAPTAPTLDALEWRVGARRFELSERSRAAAVGLGVALRRLNGTVAAGASPFPLIRAQARRLREGLATVPGVTIWGPSEPQSAIVGFDVQGVPAETVRARCRAAGIAISVMDSSAAPLHFARRKATALCRVAPQSDTTDAEIDALLEVLAELAGARRAGSNSGG